MLITPTASIFSNSNREVTKKSNLEELGFEETLLLNLTPNLAPEAKETSAQLDRHKRLALALRHLGWLSWRGSVHSRSRRKRRLRNG